MKITKLETFRIIPRWASAAAETDDGTVAGANRSWKAVRAPRKRGARTLRADYRKRPRDVERICRRCTAAGSTAAARATSALSGIDQALWDIKAKALGVPVYELLGGRVRDKMEVYSWIDSNTPEEAARCALEKKNLGFRAVKMFGVDAVGWITDYQAIDALCQKLQAIREAVGSTFGIAIDFHGRPTRRWPRLCSRSWSLTHPVCGRAGSD